MVLLGASLPGLDGYEICRRIRRHGDTPIVLLPEGAAAEDVLRAPRLGADDCLVAPWSAKRLLARIRPAFPRPTDQPPRELQFGDSAVDRSRAVSRGGRPVRLTPTEYRLVYLLALNAGRVIPPSRLIEHAWGDDAASLGRLRGHVSRLRRELGLPAEGPTSLRAVPGVGYCLQRAEPAAHTSRR